MELTTNARVLAVFPLEQRGEDPDPRAAGFFLPLDAEIVRVVTEGHGDNTRIQVAALCSVPVGQRVWCPVWIMVADQPIEPLLGRNFGQAIGLIPIRGVPSAIVPDLPWPTSILEGVKAVGNG